ncbi:MAG: hypothetical protein N2170_06650 [Bacteroidia bacterium]|nr:hypothetical protein [Bacteroidia bacterium]
MGKLGEHLACQLLRKIAPRDWEFRWPSGTPYYDILAIGPNCKIRLEVKFSTLWRTGVYKFQQLRDQPYDLLICLGLSPQEAHLWVFSKNEAFHYATPQHGGKEGEDTYWLSFPPGELQEYGGKLEAGIERLIQYFK